MSQQTLWKNNLKLNYFYFLIQIGGNTTGLFRRSWLGLKTCCLKTNKPLKHISFTLFLFFYFNVTALFVWIFFFSWFHDESLSLSINYDTSFNRKKVHFEYEQNIWLSICLKVSHSHKDLFLMLENMDTTKIDSMLIVHFSYYYFLLLLYMCLDVCICCLFC